jgi:hypothetical protein
MLRPVRDLWLPAALLAASVAVWAPRFHYGLDSPAPYDEGNTVVAAWRLLEGERLYRDVWQMHAPGSAYLLAGAFRLFGTTLGVERALRAVLLGLTAATLVVLTRRLAPRPDAGSVAVLAGLAAAAYALLPTHAPFLRPTAPALLLALLALLPAQRAIESRSARACFLAGALAGLCGVFRLDFGVYTGAAIALGLASRPRLLAPLALGAAAVAGPALAALAASGLLPEALDQMIVFPATVYPAQRRLPIYDLPAVGSALLPLLAAVGVAVVCWARGRAGASDRALLLVGLAGLAVFNYARVRSDPEHLSPIWAFSLVALAGLALRAAEAKTRLARLVPPALALGLVAWIASGLALQFGHWRARAAATGAPAPERAAGFAGFPTDLAEVTAHIRDHVPAGEALFVANARHDRILLNHVLLYFLAERAAPTRHYNLHPGLATTVEVQREIAQALEARAVRWVVVWDAPLWDEPNATLHGSGVTLLDEHLRASYRRVRSVGAFTLLERRDPDPSPPTAPAAPPAAGPGGTTAAPGPHRPRA